MDTAIPVPRGSRSGTIRGLMSVDGLPKTIKPETTRHPHAPTGYNTDKPGSNTQHGAHTDCPGSTMKSHG
ncbi:hypothetical protein DPMN_025426 [Dreissena polymorpha]|uniref:Uncharacterized protein n=1 Tax=Dreissena polymorpha TaxID=45954 RepID=A0A9D4LRB8_DREPO|nr:hypothetical protein DPMN_025426 [Dreissena polymorpha]